MSFLRLIFSSQKTYSYTNVAVYENHLISNKSINEYILQKFLEKMFNIYLYVHEKMNSKKFIRKVSVMDEQ